MEESPLAHPQGVLLDRPRASLVVKVEGSGHLIWGLGLVMSAFTLERALLSNCNVTKARLDGLKDLRLPARMVE